MAAMSSGIWKIAPSIPVETAVSGKIITDMLAVD